MHNTRPELLDDDVGTCDQRVQLGALFRILQVEGDAFLAAIEHCEIDAVGAPTRDITAHFLTAARALDLDDFRAGFSQEQCRHRPRQ